MKKCPKCNNEKEISAFGTSKCRKDGLQIYCKLCRKDYDAEYNRRRDLKKKNSVQRKREHSIRLWVRTQLKQKSCSCGESRIECLDFHHLRDKKYNVSSMYSLSKEKILEEVAKCEILCANCHRVITAKERNWYKNIESVL